MDSLTTNGDFGIETVMEETMSPINMSQDATNYNMMITKTASGRMSPIRAMTMKEYDKRISELRKENFNLKLRIFFLEEKMSKSLSGEKEDIVKMNIQLKVDLECLKKDLNEKQALLTKASFALDSITSKNAEEPPQAEGWGDYNSDNDLLSLKSLLKESEKDLDEKEKTMFQDPHELDSQIRVLTEENESLKRQSLQGDQETISRMRFLTEENQYLTEENRGIKNQLLESQQQLQQKIDHLSEENLELKSQIQFEDEEIQLKLNALAEQNESLTRKITTQDRETEASITALAQENDAFKKEASEKIQDLLKTIEGLTNNNNLLRQRASEDADKERQEFELLLDDLRKDNEALKKHAHQGDKAILGFTQALNEKNEELNELTAKLLKAESESSRNLEAYKTEIEDLKRKHQEIHSELAEKNALQEMDTGRERQYQDLESRLRKAQEEYGSRASLQDELDKCNAEINFLKQKFEDAEIYSKELKESLENKDSEIAILRLKSQEAAGHSDQEHALKRVLETKELEIQDLNEKLEKSQDALQDNAKLSLQNRSLRRALSATEATVKQKSEKMKHYRSLLHDAGILDAQRSKSESNLSAIDSDENLSLLKKRNRFGRSRSIDAYHSSKRPSGTYHQLKDLIVGNEEEDDLNQALRQLLESIQQMLDDMLHQDPEGEVDLVDLTPFRVSLVKSRVHQCRLLARQLHDELMAKSIQKTTSNEVDSLNLELKKLRSEFASTKNENIEISDLNLKLQKKYEEFISSSRVKETKQENQIIEVREKAEKAERELFDKIKRIEYLEELNKQLERELDMKSEDEIVKRLPDVRGAVLNGGDTTDSGLTGERGKSHLQFALEAALKEIDQLTTRLNSLQNQPHHSVNSKFGRSIEDYDIEGVPSFGVRHPSTQDTSSLQYDQSGGLRVIGSVIDYNAINKELAESLLLLSNIEERLQSGGARSLNLGQSAVNSILSSADSLKYCLSEQSRLLRQFHSTNSPDKYNQKCLIDQQVLQNYLRLQGEYKELKRSYHSCTSELSTTKDRLKSNRNQIQEMEELIVKHLSKDSDLLERAGLNLRRGCVSTHLTLSQMKTLGGMSTKSNCHH